MDALGLEPETLCMLSVCSTTELYRPCHERLIITYQAQHELALATFSAPLPMTPLLGYNAQLTEAFLSVIPVCQAISHFRTICVTAFGKNALSPHSLLHDSQGLGLNIHRTLPLPLACGQTSPLGSLIEPCTLLQFITTAIL